MTDRTENEAIALLHGWTKDKGISDSGILPWIDLYGNRHQHHPDYLNKWEHAGPLYVELLDTGLIVEIRVTSKDYLCGVYKQNMGMARSLIYAGRGRKVETAIARAWLAWKRRGEDEPHE